MEYKEYFKRLQEGTLPACLLLQGEEEYTKESALAKLRKKYLPQGLETMNETLFQANASESSIIEACEMLPFMGDKRLVVVRDHPLVSSAKPTTGAKASTVAKASTTAKSSVGDQGDIANYIKNIPEHVFLIFYARGNADGRKKLVSTIQKAEGNVLFRLLDDKELYTFVKRECAEQDKTMDRETMERLVFLCGRDLTILIGEIQKVCAHAGESSAVTIKDVDAVAVPNLEANVFQLLDCLLEGRYAKALTIQSTLLRDGESPIMILAVISRNIRQLYHAKLLAGGTMSKQEVEKSLGLSSYIAGRVIDQAHRMDVSFLHDVELACTQADYAIKSGMIKEDKALDGIMMRMMRKKTV